MSRLNLATFTEENEIITELKKVAVWHIQITELYNHQKPTSRSLSQAEHLRHICPEHNSTIKPLSILISNINKAKSFDRKCLQLSKLSPCPSIEMLNSLETEANLKIELNNRRDLPGLRSIGRIIQQISEWREKVREYIIPQQLNSQQNPTFDFVKVLQEEGKSLSVRDLGRDLELLDDRLSSAEDWISHCESLFIPKIPDGLLPPYVLKDLLMPCFTFLSSKTDNSGNEKTIGTKSPVLPIHPPTHNNNNKKTDRWIQFPRPVVAAQQIFNSKTTKSLKYYKHNERHLGRLIARLKRELMITDHLPKTEEKLASSAKTDVEDEKLSDEMDTDENDEISDGRVVYNNLVSEEYEHCFRIRHANQDILSAGKENDINMNSPELGTCYCKLSNDTRKVVEIQKNGNFAKETEINDRQNLVRCCLCLKWWHKSCVLQICQKWDWNCIPFGTDENEEIENKIKTNPTRSTRSNKNNNNNRVNQNGFLTNTLDTQIMSAIGKFTCIRCQKSLRPTPEQLLTLLLNLEKIEIQIFEGQLVQNLIERFLDWQGRTKRILNEVASIDEATEELLEYNRNDNDYPERLKNWIKMYCGHEVKRKFEQYNGKDYALISKIDISDDYNFNGEDDENELDDEVREINNKPPPKLNEELMNNIINIQVEGDLVEVKLPESDLQKDN